MKRAQTLFFGLLFLTALPVMADMVPDDHGNTLSYATVLAGPGTAAGILEYDTDADVFSFPFKPWTSYTIMVEPGTVLDVELKVIPPSGEAFVWEADTVWTPEAVVENASHEGAASRWYLVVTPLFEFTTGSYVLTVTEDPGQDANENSLPDAWEQEVFGDLVTADPEEHTDAFVTGRAPDDPLAVEQFTPSAAGDVVGWTAAPFGTYDLYRATTLLGPDPWEVVGTYVAGSSGGLFLWNLDPSTDPIRFYHIKFRLE